jgi:predicted ATPase
VLTAVQLPSCSKTSSGRSSTLDLLSTLAQRRGRASRFVLATYRPSDVVASGHPLAVIQQELQLHGHCTELPLRPLGVAEVGEYLANRFPRQRPPADLAQSIHRRTEGNPLFMVNVVDYWIAHAVLVEKDQRWTVDACAADVGSGVPDTLRHMIERHLERLAPEARRVLEAASVVGREFSSAIAAAALEESEAYADECCETLAGRGQFVSARGVEALAGGGVTGRYEFLHGLYPQVLYERLPAARRARLHRRIGEWQEASYGARTNEHAGELAVHFERGHDPHRAVHHLQSAAANATRKHAYREATALLERALELLGGLPDTPERGHEELSLRMALATPLLMTRGYAAPEMERLFSRVHALSRHMEDSHELVFSLAGLFRFFFVRAKFGPAGEIADQVLRVAEARERPLLAVAHSMVGLPLLSRAELEAARDHLEQAIALYEVERHGSLALEYGDDPALTSLAFLAIALWFLGYPDRALGRIREAQALAEQLGMPYSIAFARSFSAWIHVRRGEVAAARAPATPS